MFIRFKTPQGESFIRDWDQIHGINPITERPTLEGDPAKSLVVYKDVHQEADEINETVEDVMARIDAAPPDAWIVK